MRAVLVLLWLVVLAVFPGAATASSSQGTVNGRIAFSSYDASGRPEVWTMNQDGSDLRRLGPGSEPSWSSDGAWLALVSSDGEIVLVRSDGSDRHVVEIAGWMSGFESFLGPALSPDGETIAFGTVAGLYVVPAKGGEARRLASRAGSTWPDEFAARPSWSPDGRLIAFLGQDGRVSVVGADGSGLRILPGAHGAVGGRVSWSPDGSTIAYGGIVPGGTRQRVGLSTVRLDGGAPAVLVPYNGTSAEDPTWSPDGTRIAFASERNDICVANADGTVGRLTYTPPRGAGLRMHPAWQPLAAGSPPAGAPGAPPGPPSSWNRNRPWRWACGLKNAVRGLALTGRFDFARANVGDVVTYRLRLANRGDVPIGMSGVAGFYVRLDGGAHVLSVAADRGTCRADPLGWIFRPAVGIECQFGSLFPGDRVDVTVRARAKTPGELRLEGFLLPPGRRPGRAGLLRRTRVHGCTIRGSRRADALFGSPGTDVVCGLDGGDRIRPAAGPDHVYAGPGNDVVAVRDGQADRIWCGSGTDRVWADRRDRIDMDCERVERQ